MRNVSILKSRLVAFEELNEEAIESLTARMEMAGHYQIRKTRIPARVWFGNREDQAVNFFAGPHAENHCGSERPHDLLEGRSPFLALENDRGVVEIVRKMSISFVVVDAIHEEDPKAPVSVDASVPGENPVELVVTLEGGEQIDGSACFHLPRTSCRLQDFLNEERLFLRLHRGEKVMFINMDRISRVSEKNLCATDLQ